MRRIDNLSVGMEAPGYCYSQKLCLLIAGQTCPQSVEHAVLLIGFDVVAGNRLKDTANRRRKGHDGEEPIRCPATGTAVSSRNW